jgi:hypothetical protein
MEVATIDPKGVLRAMGIAQFRVKTGKRMIRHHAVDNMQRRRSSISSCTATEFHCHNLRHIYFATTVPFEEFL